MRLPRPFMRLPWTFRPDLLEAECASFAAADWRPHPQGHPGNSSLPLVALHGDPLDDGVAGPMQPTPHLLRSPYLQSVLRVLRTPIGRTRLMRLDARAEATEHVDINYYWQQRTRVHIPVVTTPDVQFLCGGEAMHMAAGTCWIFDTWRPHNVLNPAGSARIHLVVDTVGSSEFWEAAERGPQTQGAASMPMEQNVHALQYETMNVPVVMSPWELDALWCDWLHDATEHEAEADLDQTLIINVQMQKLLRNWRALWACHGATPAGWAAYAALQAQLVAMGQTLSGRLRLPNGSDLGQLIQKSLAPAVFNPQLASSADGMHASSFNSMRRSQGTHVPDLGQSRGNPASTVAKSGPTNRGETVRIERPLIIVGAPRSGSSLLFETLSFSLPVFTVGGESHRQIEGFPELRPAALDHASNRLTRADAPPGVAQAVRRAFYDALRDRDGRPPGRGHDDLRMVEKTPKNALRVPFLDAVFPDARFVYLFRQPHANVGSLIEGWQSQRFVMYPDLPGWSGPPWSFLLTPGWRRLAGAPLATIAAAQWCATQEVLLEDLAVMNPDRVHALDYEDFVADPARHVAEIAAFAGLPMDRPPPAELPLSRHTLTAPAQDKWRRHAAALQPHTAALTALAARAGAFVSAARAHHAAVANA